ncbi:hypothetical protein INR49_031286 [Caranx melampygus]|nr:hypothetical protein INR49_031286 [Caranx melampygus]
MMGHLQDVMLTSDTLSPSKDHWEVMFESGYLTLFGKEFGEDKCQARQAAQKALNLAKTMHADNLSKRKKCLI